MSLYITPPLSHSCSSADAAQGASDTVCSTGSVLPVRMMARATTPIASSPYTYTWLACMVVPLKAASFPIKVTEGPAVLMSYHKKLNHCMPKSYARGA
jgi:hypothetical protein